MTDIFSIERGSAFLKGVGGTLLMSNFVPNIEFLQLAGDFFMWTGGATMLSISIVQGLKNIKKTNLESENLALEKINKQLENEKLEAENKRQVIRQMTDITYAEPKTELENE